MELLSTFLLSLTIALLSGLGVGSGGLLVIWLTAFKDVDPILARGINLLFFVFSASAALLVRWKKGNRRKRCLTLIASLTPFSVLGTLIGVSVGGSIDGTLLRQAFGVMLILSGLYTVFRKDQIPSKSIFSKKEKKF